MRARAILALLLGLLLWLVLPAIAVGHAPQAPAGSAEPPRATVWFRPEGPIEANETYSVWPANTSRPAVEGLIWTFSCTDGPYEYEGFEFYTGGIAWIMAPLAGDLRVSGKARISVWLNSTDQAGWPTGLGAVIADVDEEGEVVAYWHSEPRSGSLPPAPSRFDFEVDLGNYTFEAGHIISFGVGVATTRRGYKVSVAFGGSRWPARAELPVLDHVRISGVSVLTPDGENRTVLYQGEGPVVLNISITDPFGNLDVAEVRLRVRNETGGVVFEALAQPTTNRTAYEAWYAATWDPSGLAPGDYVLEVGAADNSGIKDNRTLHISIVELRLALLSYAPKAVKLGSNATLSIELANNGTTTMFNLTLSVLEPDGLLLEPEELLLGDLGPGDAVLANFTLKAPVELGAGLRHPVLRATYADFRGVEHTTDLELTLELARLGCELSISVSPGEARCLDTVSIAVELSDELGQPIAGATISLWLGEEFLANLTTGDDGKASLDLRLELKPGTYTLKAAFLGSKSYEGCEATATLVVRKRKASLSLDYPDEVVAGEEFTISACLKDEEGEPIAGAELALYVRNGTSWSLLARARTDERGEATFILTLEEGGHELKVAFEGDAYHEGCEKGLAITASAPSPAAPAGAPSPIVLTGAAVGVGVLAALSLLRKRLLGRR